MFTLFCMPNFVSNPRATKIHDLNVSVPMNGENSIRDFAFSEELNKRSDSFSSIPLFQEAPRVPKQDYCSRLQNVPKIIKY